MAKELLKEMKEEFKKSAQCLGIHDIQHVGAKSLITYNYEVMTVTEMANGWCDCDEAGDIAKRDQYFSALMLHYWYKIFEYSKTCASLKLELEDYVDWLQESFDWAFRYRAWRKPFKYDYTKGEYRLDDNGEKIPEPSYGDPNAPDKIFNRCFFSTRGRHYQHSNKDVRKINYTTYSIDEGEEEYGESCNLALDEDDHSFVSHQAMMSNYVHKNKFMEALVLDGILYQDVFEETKEKKTMPIYDEETDTYEDEEYYQYSSVFNIKKLIKHLKSIDESFINYFKSNYKLNDEEAEQLKAKITSVNPNNMRKIVTQVLYNMSKDKEILSLLGL